MNFVSNQNDFLAVYPQGVGIASPGFSWADGRGTTADDANIDDVGFISKLIDSLYHDYSIDTNKVYVCGFSNGGFMTQRLACEIPGEFAAVGGLVCSMDTSLIQSCQPGEAVPMIYIAGTADPEVPYQGGSMRNPRVEPIVAVDTALQFWIDNNNCQQAVPVENIPDSVQSDSSTVDLFKYVNCDCGADVYFYKIINGGHTWPGVSQPQLPQLGNTNEDIHASYELWDFFKKFDGTCDSVTKIREGVNPHNLKVFPNPSQGILHLEADQAIRQILISDATGRQVATYQGNLIRWDNIPSGVYFLKIRFQDGRRKAVKVIKE